ncbi:MAG: PAS domain S-box protein, partial [Halanaerobiales bacterium]
MERYAKKIINMIKESIVLIDRNNTIQSVNEKTQELLSMSQAKIIGKDFNDVFNILDNNCVLNDLSTIYSNSPNISQKCLLNVNENLKTISFNIEVIKEDDKKIGLIIFIRDITALERTQNILRKSEAKFRSLYNSMLSAYTLREIIYDNKGEPVDFRYIEVNPAFEKVSGKNREEVIGKTFTEVFPDRQPYWIEVYKEVAKSGEPKDYQNWMPSTNKYLKVHVFKVGKDYIGTITVDITVNKKLEEELKREREIFKNLYSSMQNGYALCEIILEEKELDFRYLEANPEFLEMSNLKRDDVIGKRASEVFPKGRQIDYKKTNKLVQKYKEAALSGNVIRFDIQSDVLNRDLEVIVYGFGDGRFAVEFIDITDRKRLREEFIKEREKYYNLFNSMLDGFVLLETIKNKNGEVKDFLVVDMNPASEGKTGIKSKDAKGKLVSEIFAESQYSLKKSMDVIFNLYNKANESDNNEASGYIEGFNKYLYVSAFIPKEGQFATLLRDFTEQKILENEVFREKELFRSLFENTLSGFALNEIIFDDKGNPIDFIGLLVNPAFLEIAGFEEKDVLGVTASEVFDINRYGYWSKDSLIFDYAKVVKTGKPIRKEYYSKTFRKYLDVSITKVHGNVIALSFNDITEKKRAEDNLQWNLNILKQAQEIAKMGSWEYYYESNTIWLSEETKEIYGIQKDSNIDIEEIFNYISEDDLEMFKKYLFEINDRKEEKVDFT